MLPSLIPERCDGVRILDLLLGFKFLDLLSMFFLYKLSAVDLEYSQASDMNGSMHVNACSYNIAGHNFPLQKIINVVPLVHCVGKENYVIFALFMCWFFIVLGKL